MARLQRFLIENGVYHTISATRHREPLLANPLVAKAVLTAMTTSRQADGLLVLAYALLPDHMHLLCVPAEGQTISDAMKAVKGRAAKAVNKAPLHAGPLWQQGFYDRVIRNERHLERTVNYIHENPVAAGLARRPEEYRYCSAHPEAATDVERFFTE